MRAVQIEAHGGIEVLNIADIPVPQVTADKVLVKVLPSIFATGRQIVLEKV